MKDKKSNVANFLEAQWVRGKALPRGNRVTPWKNAPNDCDHPPNAIQKGGSDVLRTMRDVWEAVAAHSPDHGSTGSRDEAEQSHSARVHREATGRDRTLFLSSRTREPLLGMLDVHTTTSELSLDGCDVRLVNPVSFEGADANMVPIGDDETPCL